MFSAAAVANNAREPSGRDGWVPSSLASAATAWLNLKVSLRRNTFLVEITFCGQATESDSPRGERATFNSRCDVHAEELCALKV